MNELVPREIIQRLELRQEQLIGELDALNARLEQTLQRCARAAPASDDPETPPG